MVYIIVEMFKKIWGKCFHLLWIWRKENDGITLVIWKRIIKPKTTCGFRLKNIHQFGEDIHTLWRFINNEGHVGHTYHT
jgi:hypothetical protein